MVQTRSMSRLGAGALTSHEPLVPSELIKSERRRVKRKNRKLAGKARRRKVITSKAGKKPRERKKQTTTEDTEMLGYEDLDRPDSNKRMLMRDWIIRQVERGDIPELRWTDGEMTLLKVPWLHGSRHGWQHNDCELFKRWAIHTGKTYINLSSLLSDVRTTFKMNSDVIIDKFLIKF